MVGSDETALELRLLRARAQLALGDATAAEAELARSETSPRTQAVVTQAWLVTALAADHHRDDHRALSALDRALTAAEPENLRRPFVALGNRRLEAMLKHRLRLSASGGQAIRGLCGRDPRTSSVRSTASPSSPRRSPSRSPIVNRLVLNHMATLKTNEEIAAELYVSVNTVKAHARAVYRKLEVRNRREAVNRARQLGLI